MLRNILEKVFDLLETLRKHRVDETGDFVKGTMLGESDKIKDRIIDKTDDFENGVIDSLVDIVNKIDELFGRK